MAPCCGNATAGCTTRYPATAPSDRVLVHTMMLAQHRSGLLLPELICLIFEFYVAASATIGSIDGAETTEHQFTRR